MKAKTKAAIAITSAALVLGTGGVAVAETATAPMTGHGHQAGKVRLKRIEHGQFVTKDPKTGAQVTNDVAGGSVTVVSATAISVKSTDGTTVSFTVSSATKVHVKGQAKGTDTTIASIKTGQQVLVVGTGTGPFAATRVLAR